MKPVVLFVQFNANKNVPSSCWTIGTTNSVNFHTNEDFSEARKVRLGQLMSYEKLCSLPKC